MHPTPLSLSCHHEGERIKSVLPIRFFPSLKANIIILLCLMKECRPDLTTLLFDTTHLLRLYMLDYNLSR